MSLSVSADDRLWSSLARSKGFPGWPPGGSNDFSSCGADMRMAVLPGSRMNRAYESISFAARGAPERASMGVYPLVSLNALHGHATRHLHCCLLRVHRRVEATALQSEKCLRKWSFKAARTACVCVHAQG
jgi:hypothetical protein